MKRWITLFLTLALLLSCFAVFPASALADVETSENGWSGSGFQAPLGSGTKEDPYLISSAENLNWLSRLSKNGDQRFYGLGYDNEAWTPSYDEKTEELYYNWSMLTESEKTEAFNTLCNQKKTVNLSDFEKMPYIYLRQTCDIDLNGKTLTSIASYWIFEGIVNGTKDVKGQWFSGHYDGQGYAIQNGTITAGGSNPGWSSGLFGNLWGATIENLTFDNIHVTGTGCMGIVAGRALTPTDLSGEASFFAGKENIIRNINVKDTCTVTQKHYDKPLALGGIIGRAYNTTVENCTSGATVKAERGSSYVGGVVGLLTYDSVVNRCIYTGKLTFAGGNLKYQNAFGGIVGSWEGTDQKAEQGRSAITNCLNLGSFSTSAVSSGEALSYGGILGRTFELPSFGQSAYIFQNNINAGAAPDLSEVSVGSLRCAAGIGSAWNPDSAANGSWARISAENCYTVNTFLGKGTSIYSLLPSDDCPIVCSRVYNEVAVAQTKDCVALSAEELEALPLFHQLFYRQYTNGSLHPILGAQIKENDDGTYSLRFVSGLDSLDYQTILYTTRVTTDSTSDESTKQISTVYNQIIVNDKVTPAEDFGFKYFSLLPFDGLQKDTEYLFGLTPSAVRSSCGVDYTVGGRQIIARFYNGKVTFEKVEVQPEIRIVGTDISKFKIVIPAAGAYYEFYVAQQLVRHIQRLSGITLSVVKDSEPTTAHEIVIGKTNRGTSASVKYDQYAVIPDASCTEIAVNGWLSARHLMEAITNDYFPEGGRSINLRRYGDSVLVEENNPFLGTLTAPMLETVDQSYLKPEDAKDIRLMYHNIQGYTNKNPSASVQLLIDIYDYYQPDILCLQECKQFEAVVQWLCDNDYTMVRFDKNNGYPNNNGQGNPIFFKKDQFELVDASYACFRNGDKGSTVVTLREIASGRVFAVTNSHFCANSNANNHEGFGCQRRNEDAQNLVAEIKAKVLTNPDVEFVLSGGDFNTRTFSKAIYNGKLHYAYQTLIESGMTNIRDLIPDEKETMMATYNTYPSFNSTYGLYNLSTVHNQDKSMAIDHIFYRMVTENPITVKHYTILHDTLVGNASDHFPHMIDFSWNF